MIRTNIKRTKDFNLEDCSNIKNTDLCKCVMKYQVMCSYHYTKKNLQKAGKNPLLEN